VTTETANLMLTLKAGGAESFLCAATAEHTGRRRRLAGLDFEISTFAIKGEETRPTTSTSTACWQAPADNDGRRADLVSTLHSRKKDQAGEIIAGTEETTTGVIRLKSMEDAGVLLFPVVR